MLYLLLFTQKTIFFLIKIVKNLELLNEISWLGIAGKQFTDKIDTHYYSVNKMYRNSSYNLKGLFEWEAEMVATHFNGCRTLCVTGAGGGREVIALAKKGFEVTGFECHKELASLGNSLLNKESLQSSIIVTQRDAFPDNDSLYDGLILGWGMYMLINSKDARIRFLKAARKHVQPGSPLLVSFFFRNDKNSEFERVVKVANRIRKIFGLRPLEIGDRLQPNLVHFFSRNEITEELKEGGFKTLVVNIGPYGHAVAEAV